ncbi:MAG TPA: hypothetical protein VHG34_05225 [Nitrososphaeraceae archaeon]|nr:hypothetical protein [Nitrososphaeraceae archaeon]
MSDNFSSNALWRLAATFFHVHQDVVILVAAVMYIRAIANQ